MPTIDSIDSHQLTAKKVCQHVITSALLPQLLRQMIIDDICFRWQPSGSKQSIFPQADFVIGVASLRRQTLLLRQRLRQRERNENQTDIELDRDSQINFNDSLDLESATIVDRDTKLQQFKQEIWGNKVGSYYLTRKAQLDRVVCSIIQVVDSTIAQELYFRICSEPKSFSKLALNYSQGAEAFDGGKVGPIQISKLHPTISTQILLLEPGQISPLFTIDNFYIFVRLECVIPAQFDDDLRQVLLDELFEQWLQSKIVSEIGSVSIQDIQNDLN
jgi:parvulin-like peptidyl-prolyl isomerase